jgi:hypothetical protein
VLPWLSGNNFTFCYFFTQVSSAMARWPDLAATYEPVQRDLNHLMTWTLRMRNVLSPQERLDARQESQRLQTLVHLLHCQHSISQDSIQVTITGVFVFVLLVSS